jgi:tetratricopeptide (TPR) repeat protein
MADTERPVRPNIAAFVLAVVPGLGHLVIGRSRRGYLFFLVTTFCWNLAFLSAFATTPPLGTWSFRLGAIIGAGIWLFSLLDAFRLAVWGRLPRIRRRREEAFRRAVTHYLRHEFPKAREIFDGLLDLDPGDAVTRLYLATLERRAGRFDRAIHHARKALRAAPAHPFHPEIERELLMSQEALRASH